MRLIMLVGIGGFAGSVLRYWFSTAVQAVFARGPFPAGTLFVNVVGCLLIGFLSQFAESREAFSAETRSLILIGLMGGFTTFSTFSNESLDLLRAGQSAVAVANLGMHILLGLGAVWLGREAAFWLLN